MADADVKSQFDELMRVNAEFRKQNDARLAALEKRGSAPGDLTEKVEKLNDALSSISSRLDEMSVKGGRPGSTTASDDAEVEQMRSAHRKAFHRYIVRGDASALEALNQKTVAVGDASAGGYLVPSELDTRIREVVQSISKLRSLVEVTTGGERLEFLFDTGGETSGWVGETDARPETSTPGVARVAPSFGEIYAAPKATQKALDDMPNVEPWLARAVGREFAKREAIAILTGNGVSKPRGLLTAPMSTAADAARPFGTVQQVNSGASGDFDSDNLHDMVYALKPEYRANAVWLMESTTVKKVRKMVDDVGNYLWQPGIQAGQPSQLLGHAIVEEPNWPVVAAGAMAVGFGDWRTAYLLVDVRGAVTLRDPYTSRGNVVFYTTRREGGGVMDSQAYKVLVLS